MSEAAERAERLIGTPFRLQGRDTAIALDCLGVVLVAFDLPGDAAPKSYGRRRHDLMAVEATLAGLFRRVPRPTMRIGDLLVLRCGADRLHFGIAGREGLIHADAAIGRTVCRPWPTAWPIKRVYRRRKRSF